MRLLSLLRPATLCLGFLVAFSSAEFLSAAPASQSQNNASVAEAARKAKDQKKASPKETLVITEETLALRPASADTGEAPPAGTVINTTPVMPGVETPATPAPDDAKKAPDTTSAPPVSPTPDDTKKAADTASAPPAEPAKSPDSSSSAPITDAAATAADDAKKAEEQAAEIAKTKELLAQAQTELDLAKRELALQNDTYFSNPDYAHDLAGKAKLDDQQKLIGDKQASVQELKDRLEKLLQEAGISPEAEQTPTPTAQ